MAVHFIRGHRLANLWRDDRSGCVALSQLDAAFGGLDKHHAETCMPRICSPCWVCLLKEGTVLGCIIVSSCSANATPLRERKAKDLYAGDLCFRATLSRAPIRHAVFFMKRDARPAHHYRNTMDLCTRDLYSVKVKAGLGLHHQRAPILPRRFLREAWCKTCTPVSRSPCTCPPRTCWPWSCAPTW